MKSMTRQKIFSPSELSEARKKLIAERDKVLPVEVQDDGYYYDPHELFQILKKRTGKKGDSKIKG
jgi:hypothetical protein